MPATVDGFSTTTAVLGGSKVMKVRDWQCYSEPSNTYFQIRARVQTTQQQVEVIADGFSATIEELFAQGDVTDVVWSQDVTPGGQLVSIYTVYYYISAVNKSGFVEVPAGKFTQGTVDQLIAEDANFGTTLFNP